MDNTKSADVEKERLQSLKTQLLHELYQNMLAENEAVLAENIELLEELTARAAELMDRIDAADARLKELVNSVFAGQVVTLPLTEEQKHLLTEMKQLHKQMTGELMKQRTAVVEQIKELRQAGHMVGAYRKNPVMEGVFVDQKK